MHSWLKKSLFIYNAFCYFVVNKIKCNQFLHSKKFLIFMKRYQNSLKPEPKYHSVYSLLNFKFCKVLFYMKF